jgi:hypothetical protein
VGRITRLLVAAAVAVPLVGSAAGPAAACACVPSGAKQIVHQAGAVIAGRIENQITVDATHTRSIVKVQGVYRGNVAGTIYVDSDLGPGGGSSCAVLYPVGSVIDPMVLQKAPGASYTTEPCVIGSVPHLRALLGAARPPPLGGASPNLTGSAMPVPVAASTPISGMSWAAVGLGFVLAVVLIAAFARWSGRRAIETTSPFDDVPAVPPGEGTPDEGTADGTNAPEPPEPGASD